MFNSSGAMACTCCSLCLLFCGFVLHGFDTILYWSDKSFLTQNSSQSRIFIILLTVWKMEGYQWSLDENCLDMVHTSNNTLRGSWLAILFSPHMKNAIHSVWFAFDYLDCLVNENLFCAFQWVNLSMYTAAGSYGTIQLNSRLFISK